MPIPGTRRIKHLDENLGALNVSLSDSELASIGAIFPPDAACGTRYAENVMHMVEI